MKNYHVCVVAAAAAVLASLPCAAETNYWISGGGNLGVAGNWSLGAPVAGQSLCFTNPASYAVTNSVYTGLNAGLIFDATGGTVTYVGTSGRNTDHGEVVVGCSYGSTATVEQVKGYINPVYGSVVVGARGRGHLTMSGPSTSILTYNDVLIGVNSSNNTMVVRDGAILSKVGGVSLTVGQYGAENTLTVADGGIVTNKSYLYVGVKPEARSNTVAVTGNGALLWLNGGLYNWVGNYGDYSTLVVSNQGAVIVSAGVGGLTIGQYCYNNKVLVTGAGSVLNCASNLTVTAYSGNRLEVRDGGRVSADGKLLLKGAASGCRASVENPGSSLQAGMIDVGIGSSAALLKVADGGIVSCPDIVVGRTGTANYRIEVNGGTLLVTNAAGSARLDVVCGSVVLTNGAVLKADRLCATNTAAAYCRVTAVLGSQSAGIELTASGSAALDLGGPGALTLVFSANPADPLENLQGLSMPGDQTVFLTGLIGDGRLACQTAALSPTSLGRFGVFYDAESAVTFVGVRKQFVGTLLSIQ